MFEIAIPKSRELIPSFARQRSLNLGWLSSVPFLLFFLLPVVALLWRTPLQGVWNNLSKPQVYQAITLSLTTSAVTAFITIIFGTPVAFLMARRSFPFKRAVDTLIDLPTMMPPAVAGVAMLMAFGRRGIIGSWLDEWGVTIAFTTMAVIIAQTFIAAPFYIKAAIVGFASVDTELEQAAALDGATRWNIFRYVTMPLSWMALLSGAVMTFARALGEFGATIIFAGNFPGRTQTMPLAIYIGFEVNLDVALTLSVILIGISFLALIIIKVLFRQ